MLSVVEDLLFVIQIELFDLRKSKETIIFVQNSSL